MANTQSYYYWVDVYTPDGGSWEIDSFLSHREFPTETLLTLGVEADAPTSGQYQRVRGPVIRTAGMSDSEFDALMQTYKDNIPPTPFDGSSSSS